MTESDDFILSFLMPLKKRNRILALQTASTADVGLLSSAANKAKTVDWISRYDQFTDEVKQVVSV